MPEFCPQRQTDREAAAVALTRTLRFDSSFVSFDEALDQREPQPALTPRFCSIFLAKTLEYEREKLRRDSLSGIFDAHDCFGAIPFAINFDHPARIRKLNRVVEQIDEGLNQARAIASDRFVLAVAGVEFQPHLARASVRAHRLDSLADRIKK